MLLHVWLLAMLKSFQSHECNEIPVHHEWFYSSIVTPVVICYIVKGINMIGNPGSPVHMALELSDTKRPHSIRCIWQALITKSLGSPTTTIWHKEVNLHLMPFNTTAVPLAQGALRVWTNGF